MFFNRNKGSKDKNIDVASLNEILQIGKRLMHIIYVVTIVVLILLGTYLLREWKILHYLGELLAVISPIFIGIVVAWLFDPIVSWLQSKKIPRIVGCILVYLLLLLVLFIFVYSFVPIFVEQISDFVGTIPDIFNDLKGFANKVFDFFGQNGADAKAIENKIYSLLEGFASDLTTNLPNLLLSVGKGLFNGGLSAVLGLMIGFYMLFDFNKINDALINNMPISWRKNYQELGSRINSSLRDYVQGILLIMLLVFITQSIGLTLAGIKAPLIFALFCALTDVIPYFGPYIGAIPAVIVGFTQSPLTGILCIVSIVVVQLLENNFYQPLIMGHTMKLHPVTIMIGLLIFQHFFGIIGMVIATPAIACIKVVCTFINEKLHITEMITKTEIE
ncbi:MAG: AI-2E family transporter [bacterium]|nr:AI-2E family transporter [bacterium]